MMCNHFVLQQSKMQSAAVVLALCLVVAVHSAKVPQEKYTTQYDGVKLQEILTSERLLKSYIDCLLDRGPCNPDAKLLKEAIPESLENECAKCSEEQKSGVEESTVFLIENKPELWEQLKKKYDPNNKYGARYDHYLKKAQEKRG